PLSCLLYCYIHLSSSLYLISSYFLPRFFFSFFFFFTAPATTEIYTLSLHDALPIFPPPKNSGAPHSSTAIWDSAWHSTAPHIAVDRKSTRLNSSHVEISYAVFCLKKKKKKKQSER